MTNDILDTRSDLRRSIQSIVNGGRTATTCDRKARDVLDAVYCHGHNLWSSLEGNTAETDIEWFAQILFEQSEDRRNWRWENAPEKVRRFWLGLTETTLRELPRLMSRQANRCKHIAEAAKLALEGHQVVQKVREAEVGRAKP